MESLIRVAIRALILAVDNLFPSAGAVLTEAPRAPPHDLVLAFVLDNDLGAHGRGRERNVGKRLRLSRRWQSARFRQGR